MAYESILFEVPYRVINYQYRYDTSYLYNGQCGPLLVTCPVKISPCQENGSMPGHICAADLK